jgi:hypothetical protein
MIKRNLRMKPSDFVDDDFCTVGTWPPKPLPPSTWTPLDLTDEEKYELGYSDIYLYTLSQIHKNLNFTYNRDEILNWSQEQKEAKAKELREFLGIKMVLGS